MVQMTLKSILANQITNFVLQWHHHQIQLPKKPRNKWDSPFKAGYSTYSLYQAHNAQYCPGIFAMVFTPHQLNHWIQQSKKNQKQMGLTFQSWILHLQEVQF